MRIAIDVTPLIQDKPTGVHLITRFLTQTLIAEHPQDQFVLLALAPRAIKSRIKELPFSQLPNTTIKVWPLPARLFTFIYRIWQGWGFPPVELITGKIDVFHSFDWFHLPSMAPATSLVFDMTTKLFPEWHDNENTKVQNTRLAAVAKSCSHVFSLSKATDKDLVAAFPDLVGKTSVLYPDCAEIFTKDKKAADSAELKVWGLKPGYILSVGTLEPRKNILELLKAYDKLPKDLQAKHPLVLVGGEGWKLKLPDLINKNKNIKLLGYIDNIKLPVLYRQAHAFVYPSLYEGFGIPVLEAIRCGCPVLTSNLSSLPEVAGEAAVYIDPYNGESLYRGLYKLLTLAPKERREMIEVGLKYATKFSYKITARAMMAEFKRLVAKK